MVRLSGFEPELLGSEPNDSAGWSIVAFGYMIPKNKGIFDSSTSWF